MLTTPLLEWFDDLNIIHQTDVAIITSTMLSDDMQMPEGEEAISWLRDWLSTDDEFPYRTLGKLCSFIAVFESFFAGRFTQESWNETAKMHEYMRIKAVEEGRDLSFIENMIAKLPQRSIEWIAIGREWEQMKAKLSYEVSRHDPRDGVGSS